MISPGTPGTHTNLVSVIRLPEDSAVTMTDFEAFVVEVVHATEDSLMACTGLLSTGVIVVISIPEVFAGFAGFVTICLAAKRLIENPFLLYQFSALLEAHLLCLC